MGVTLTTRSTGLSGKLGMALTFVLINVAPNVTMINDASEKAAPYCCLVNIRIGFPCF
ncbi:hypothetical protein CRENPOLYSF1_450028 [Crenothrix polyspora]|uniref:Uncharacterized protein n=1 Tax=Crenothrix polyspora TaxID=360316 RepID=A0A1R4HCA8_9GAMM|nr:hypothetical protein CRENPOLYSF1_450028 [Crenothrix polyspora]